jgi:FkbM family methyltransferase
MTFMLAHNFRGKKSAAYEFPASVTNPSTPKDSVASQALKGQIVAPGVDLHAMDWPGKLRYSLSVLSPEAVSVMGLQKIVRFVLDKMGWSERMSFVAMMSQAALDRIAARGITVGTVVDIGASNGMWSGSVMAYFPDAQYLLIEAQEVHEAELKRFVADRPNTQYILKAAGEKTGKIYFDADEAFSGQATTTRNHEGLIEVPVCSIDEEIASRALPGPYLLKFDVHGFEMPILRGAEQTLQNTSLLIMECYNFKIAPESLLFHDMCRHLHDLGFRVADISEPLWRPRDRMLWQMDIFFVRAEGPEFQRNSYK